ncbi:hypothetical protein E6Q11_04315 [Candidatus Dojkabacteria bacterium]|uniref:Uncharacterized protein n=1 Tax=Candidatus Dojkabacteria bacterium TaxID=2099670 RepID=A0A5C7J7T5_9BACT|nr:MAG: hypothetical protein E6Q11_04315 [Candidatus Dojkabacteria bacterium]
MAKSQVQFTKDGEEKLQKIREKCVEANPEIAHGTMGCDIRHKATGNTWKFYKWHKWAVNVACVMTDKGIVQWEDGDYEIIGREVRLADILYMLSQRKERWVLSGFGIKISTSTENGVHETLLPINLLEDNLEDLPDETVDFIFNLIENK